jgi:hypothetical protein
MKPWGEPYGEEPIQRGKRKPPVYMRRGRYNRVRFYTAKGRQVGPEQNNVVPALAYALAQGWKV